MSWGVSTVGGDPSGQDGNTSGISGIPLSSVECSSTDVDVVSTDLAALDEGPRLRLLFDDPPVVGRLVGIPNSFSGGPDTIDHGLHNSLPVVPKTSGIIMPLSTCFT